MPFTILLQGASANQLHVRLSPLAELGALLHAVVHADHHPRSGYLQERIQAAPDGALTAQAVRFAPLYGALRARFFLPLDVSPAIDRATPAAFETELEAEIAAIGSLRVSDFVAMCAETIGGRTRDLNYKSLLARKSARAEFLRRVRRISPERLAFVEDLLRVPDQVRGELQEFLRVTGARWLAADWRDRRATLTADVARRRAEVVRHGIGMLVRLAPTAMLRTNPDRVVFDKVNHAVVNLGGEPVVLVPSFHNSPHMIIKSDLEWPVVIQYDVDAEAETQTPFIDVARRLAALRDPVRIKLCRAMLRQSRTTVDLAINMGLTQPQVSRHLRALREAGLVTSIREGRVVYYSLDTETVRRIGDDILAALRR